MEEFLRSLSFSCSITVEDVVYPNIKILDWIYKTSKSDQLSYKDVENIGKGILYLSSCYTLFSKELPDRILEKYPFFRAQVKSFFNDETRTLHKPIAEIFRQIAQTKDGLKHIFILDSILSILHESNEVSINLECFSNGHFQNSAPGKMKTIARKIFQLPEKQINIAIDRMLKYIPFNVVGYVFCESDDCFLADSYLIIAHKIYQKLFDGSINTFFIKSLYLTTSIQISGKRFYYLCLRNKDFVNGIISFFIRVLTQLLEHGVDPNIDNLLINLEHHRLDNILYLIWVTLSHHSPCYSEFYKQIMDAELGTSLFILNKFDRFYE